MVEFGSLVVIQIQMTQTTLSNSKHTSPFTQISQREDWKSSQGYDEVMVMLEASANLQRE